MKRIIILIATALAFAVAASAQTAEEIAAKMEQELAKGDTQGISFTFDMKIAEGADTVILHTNLEQATRALSLLLDNARKFTHPAEADIAAGKTVKEGKVVLGMELQGDKLAFVVEDNGIGVPPEEAEHIFDEFVQLDEYYDGTGIGLTVARSIARRLGGDIVLDTNYTGGARFVFTLP